MFVWHRSRRTNTPLTRVQAFVLCYVRMDVLGRGVYQPPSRLRRSKAWRTRLLFKGTLSEHLLNVFHNVHAHTDGALARFSSRDPAFHSVSLLFNLWSVCGRLLSIRAQHPLRARHQPHVIFNAFPHVHFFSNVILTTCFMSSFTPATDKDLFEGNLLVGIWRGV